VHVLHELFPVLEEIVTWHLRGTRYNIHVDPSDGLLYAGEPGVQLTWMDAKVGDWVVTPRVGKPVEISALWYNALGSMSQFARALGKSAAEFESLAEKARAGFQRFRMRRRAAALTFSTGRRKRRLDSPQSTVCGVAAAEPACFRISRKR
jgi:predicted glycogen debranching enzyme